MPSLFLRGWTRRAGIGIGLAAAVRAGGSSSAIGQDAVRARMDPSAALLGVSCDHCHVPDRWTDRSKPTFDFAARMSRMVVGLNAGVLKDRGGVTCGTCHRGPLHSVEDQSHDAAE